MCARKRVSWDDLPNPASELLWTTKAELVTMFSLRPDTCAVVILPSLLTYPDHAPIPFWELVERHGPWPALAALEAPFMATTGDDVAARCRVIQEYLMLTASTLTVAIPIPEWICDRWMARWRSLAEIIGEDAAAVIAEMWDEVERSGPHIIPPPDWYEKLSAAISVKFGSPPRWNPNALVAALVGAIARSTPRTVSELAVQLRALAWQWALHESRVVCVRGANEPALAGCPSLDLLQAIDNEYESLLHGMAFFGEEHVSCLWKAE